MNTQEQSAFDHHPRLALFDGLPVPVCLVDGDCRLVDMNRSALSFWGVEPGDVLGQRAIPTLGIVPSDGEEDAWRRTSPPRAHPRLPCRITTPDGQVRQVSILYTPLNGAAPPLGALFIIEGSMAAVLSDVPDWAFRDPVTGLGNRHLWEREAAAWSSRSGCVVFLDLDDLKEVNDLHGHVAGDRLLAAAGQALASLVPSGALAVRYGGDEFVAVLPDPDEAAAEAWTQEAVRRVAAASADLPIVPRLSHGVAAFGPGGLQRAVQRADDVLYERKGVLLPAASGGRIILTREGRSALRQPGMIGHSHGQAASVPVSAPSSSGICERNTPDLWSRLGSLWRSLTRSRAAPLSKSVRVLDVSPSMGGWRNGSARKDNCSSRTHREHSCRRRASARRNGGWTGCGSCGRRRRNCHWHPTRPISLWGRSSSSSPTRLAHCARLHEWCAAAVWSL